MSSCNVPGINLQFKGWRELSRSGVSKLWYARTFQVVRGHASNISLKTEDKNNTEKLHVKNRIYIKFLLLSVKKVIVHNIN